MNRRIVCAVLCIICILTGCGQPKDEEVSTAPFSLQSIQSGYDGQPFFESAFSSFVKTENGYYYYDQSYRLSYINNLTYLMYFDKDTKKAVPVCSKADCTHTAEDDCDAIFSMTDENEDKNVGYVHYLWYYNGNLYTMANNYENNVNVYYIYQISFDGSKRTKYIKIIEGDITGFNMYYHRGYIYAAFAYGEDKAVLYRVKLEKNAKPELIYEFTGTGAMFTGFDLYDTGITFMNSYFTDTTYENGVGTIEYYNPVTEEITTLMDEAFFDSYKVVENDIYYSKDGEIYAYNINSGNEKLFYTCDYPVYISYDGKYLYAEVCSINLEDYSEHYIYVLSPEGELVDTIQAASSQDCYFGDEDYLFQMFDLDEDLKGKADMAVIKAFDKSQIGTEKHEWIDLTIN